jgi:hypothetical protein
VVTETEQHRGAQHPEQAEQEDVVDRGGTTATTKKTRRGSRTELGGRRRELGVEDKEEL